MKIEKLINVRLSGLEVKAALLEYLSARLPDHMFNHIKDNYGDFEAEGTDIIILVDGIAEIEER